ncbi:hypothetical protein NEOLEDRAFT_1061313, partial [Neolentinus lepideus HHB14362 ss-1]
VRDAENAAACLQHPDHSALTNCGCTHCVSAIASFGCPWPHHCFECAQALLDTLPPKWDPQQHQRVDDELGLPDPSIPPPDRDWVKVDPSCVTSGPLENVLRIFTTGDIYNGTPPEMAGYDPSHLVTIATDGSCMHNSTANTIAGAGGFASPGHLANFSV